MPDTTTPESAACPRCSGQIRRLTAGVCTACGTQYDKRTPMSDETHMVTFYCRYEVTVTAPADSDVEDIEDAAYNAICEGTRGEDYSVTIAQVVVRRTPDTMPGGDGS